MKVLLTCPKLNQGGVERCVVDSANYLSEKNIENHICSNGGRMMVELNNTKHFTLPIHKKNPITILKNSFKLAKYIKENNIDIVHAQSRAPAWVSLMACKITNTAYVTTYHGAFSHENFLKRLYSWPVRAGAKTAAISDYIKNHLQSIYNLPNSQIKTIYRSFNKDKFNLKNLDMNKVKEIKEKYDLNNTTTLCLVGRFSKIKGQVQLLEALNKIKDENWKLLLVGSGNKQVEEDVANLVKSYKLEDKVILTGNQTNPEYFYAAADICLSVRITPEAFGLTPLEAQALEKIIIATNQGGHLETVKDGETGYLIQHDDLDNWAEKIKLAINLPTEVREQMGKAGRKWVESKYTLEKMCEAEVDMYNEVLQKKGN
tara:strand:- start:398 stop:1516 length:1119 start_codon:yes stop_codon:yes gene_type:complete